MKKIIISTHHEDVANSYNNLLPNLEVRDYNMYAIHKNNALPLIYPSIPMNDEMLKELFKWVSWVIIYGGYDVDPLLYGQDKNQQGQTYHKRDKHELRLIDYCFRNNVPLFGICRWYQLINIYLGGTLIQDINTNGSQRSLEHSTDIKNRKELSHKVNFVSGSWLHSLFNTKTIITNSFHHQAIDLMGKDLTIAAKSEDWIVEAFQHDNKPILWVQRHPEFNYEVNKESKTILDYIIWSYFTEV